MSLTPGLGLRGGGSRGGRWGEEWLEGRRQLAAVHNAVQEAGIKTFPPPRQRVTPWGQLRFIRGFPGQAL